MGIFFAALTNANPRLGRSFIRCLAILLLTVCPLRVSAVEYQSADAFIQQAFNGNKGTTKVFWVDDTAKQVIESILAHSFNKMRIRYWQQDNETVWILDEIGKEAPITVGIHIKDQAIVRTKVLVYRESRGDEVRHDFFTDQFKSARLDDQTQLDQHIDGITGATLSVRALTKLSRIALWLDNYVTKAEATKAKVTKAEKSQ